MWHELLQYLNSPSVQEGGCPSRRRGRDGAALAARSLANVANVKVLPVPMLPITILTTAILED
jgi:hypothetical protein